MRIASRMAITQFIGGQAVVLAGSSTLGDPLPPTPPTDPGAAVTDRRPVTVGGDLRP